VGTLTATPPATITVPATDTDGAFSVSWTASSTPSVTYKLERSDDGGATFNQVYSGTALTYAVSGLADGSYVFRVKATKSSYVDSTYTTSGACEVTPTAVDAPASITVPATDTDGAFTVSWPASALTGVTYKLERSDDGGSTFSQVYSGTALSRAVSGLADGSYVFRVKATKSGYLDSTYTTAGAACTVTLTAVEAPVSISVPATSTSTSLTVGWGASPTSGVSYVLERSLNGGAFTQVYSGTALTATVSGMSNGSYVFRVKATKSGYVSSAYVTSGTCVGTLTATPPATITVPATDTDGTFSVSWTASSTPSVTYKLERSDDGGEFAQVYSGTALTYAVSGLADGSYVFRVKATKSSYVDSAYTTSGACVVSP
jgi:uncharacterized protein (DUF2249 family)